MDDLSSDKTWSVWALLFLLRRVGAIPEHRGLDSISDFVSRRILI